MITRGHKGQSNIPKQIRDILKASFERKEKLLEAADKVSKVYKGAEEEILPTRKGIWKKYIQHNYSIPIFNGREKEVIHDRFCAVYVKDKRPLAIIRGEIADKENINRFLKIVTKKIIEQVSVFSMPKKSLTEENGLSYGLRIGLIIAIFLSLL